MVRIALAVASLVMLYACTSTREVPPAALAELAPSGVLRAAINFGNPLFTARDPQTGEGAGITVDLAREFGRRLGVPVQLIPYESGGQLTAGLRTGGWDVAFLAFEQARTREITYSPAYAETDATYLVRADSRLRTAADVDQKGVRIAVSSKGGNDLFLSRTLLHATLVRAASPEAALQRFVSDKLDAYANLKPGLLTSMEKYPGLRVVEGRYTVIGYAAGVPKGREAAAKFLSAFVEEAKASGLVGRIIVKNGVRGVNVAPAVAAP